MGCCGLFRPEHVPEPGVRVESGEVGEDGAKVTQDSGMEGGPVGTLVVAQV